MESEQWHRFERSTADVAARERHATMALWGSQQKFAKADQGGAHACMKAPGCSGWATSSAWLAVGRPTLQLTEGRLLARLCMMQICSRALLFA